jgi:hypothetical protein
MNGGPLPVLRQVASVDSVTWRNAATSAGSSILERIWAGSVIGRP